MKILKPSLRRGLKWAGITALAFGLPLTAAMQAQDSSNNNYNYNYNNAKKPRYSGKSWTDSLVLEGGGGGTTGVQNTQNLVNPGFNVLLGAGYKFNDRLSLIGEWNFNDLGVPHSLANAVAQVPGGNEHLWTATLNPKFNVIRKGRFDGYAIGGGGFSRSLVSFTRPVLVPCGYGYGYGYGFGYGGACAGNVTVSHHSSNQAALDLGGGAEFRFSPYSRYKLFIEARYLKAMTPKSNLPPGYDASVVPATIGIRW
jgi:opacity protein-like surface antigen